MDILAGVHCTWKNGDPCLQGSQPWRSSGEILQMLRVQIQQEASNIKVLRVLKTQIFPKSSAQAQNPITHKVFLCGTRSVMLSFESSWG